MLALDVSVCPLANLTGLPCPGCGLTRAALALLQGDVGAAWRFHPAVFVALPVLGAAFVQAVRPIARPSPGGDRLTAWVAALVLALMIALWVARFAGAFGGPVAVDGPLWQLTR